MEGSQVAISPLEIRTGNGEPVTVCHGFPETLRKSQRFIGFNSMHAVGDFGYMEFHHFPGNGFSIWSSEYDISRPVDFLSRGGNAMLELSIPLVSKCPFQLERKSARVCPGRTIRIVICAIHRFQKQF